ncbi:MAG: cytochrome c biogenesis protein ResB [Candidatus Omnitrophica bacterium]|nr:cytochrome c biogenesis protein ResB [Candidatus Omnitrophota bacterium]
MTNFLNSIFRFLASLKLAVILLVGFAVLLGIATFYESSTSTEAAQRVIYKSAWFDFLLFFLGVNVFCAAMNRLPWNKRHAGFVITHLGIIIILIGSMITRQFGVEGQLVLQEGQAADSIQINESVFAVAAPRLNARKEFDPWFMNKGIPPGKELRYELDNTGIVCYIDDYLFNPRFIERVANHNPQPNPAVQIAIHQPGQSEGQMKEWLFANMSNRNQLNLGMAVIEFRQVQTAEELQTALEQPSSQEEAGPAGVVTLRNSEGQAIQTIPVKNLMSQPYAFEWEGKPYKVILRDFFPRAAVENNDLINRENGPMNPAIRFTLTSPDGDEDHLAFSEFPDLGSFHGSDPNKSGLTALFKYPKENFSKRENRAVILLDGDGKLHYRAASESGKWISGEVEIGSPFQTVWPAVNISVQQMLPNAQLTEEIVDAGENASGPHNNPVAHVRVEYNGKSVERYVSYNRPSSFSVGGEAVAVELGQKKYPLGFAVQLIDFQAPRYPGTNRPARFQSVVKLIDPEQQVEEERLVYMNNPLAYNRFLVYQSGYEEGRNGAPDVSIFSVAWAPGTSTIYVGSIILCMGMVLIYVTRRTPSIPIEKNE